MALTLAGTSRCVPFFEAPPTERVFCKARARAAAEVARVASSAPVYQKERKERKGRKEGKKQKEQEE